MFFRFALLLLAAGANTQRSEGDPCLDVYHNVPGRCTPAYECISAKNDYLQRNISPTFCGSRYNNNIVCCRDRIERETPKPVKDDNNTREKTQKRVSERKCEEYSGLVTQNVVFMTLLPDPDIYSTSVPNCTYIKKELVVGGEDAFRGEFPHMAAIGWLDFNGTYAFNCGGSLISSRFVLTAGHCTYSSKAKEPEPSIVRLGEHNIDPAVDDGANPIDVKIKKIHKHPDYKPPIQYNDIALLEFDEVRFNSFIRPACLWNRFNFGGHLKAIATGWGVNDTTKETRKDQLQKVSLSLMNNLFCDRKLYELRNRNWYGLEDTQLCAGELREMKGTCQGDSGSPLQVVSNENQCIFYVLGIVSFGQRCAIGKPTIFTRVFKYLDWIEKIVWPGESILVV